MMVGKINYDSVAQLRTTFSNNSELISNATSMFDSYVNETVTAMEQNLMVIRERMNQAKAEYETAKSDLASCEASQKYDDEEGEWYPSCDAEAHRLKEAESKYEQCKEVYERANFVMLECKSKISEYKSIKGDLDALASKSRSAVCVINRVLGDAVDYRDAKVVLGTSALSDYTPNESVVSDAKKSPIRINSVEVRYGEKEQKTKDKSKAEKYYEGIDKLNNRMEKSKNVCPKCHKVRPCMCDIIDNKGGASPASGRSINTEKKNPVLKPEDIIRMTQGGKGY